MISLLGLQMVNILLWAHMAEKIERKSPGASSYKSANDGWLVHLIGLNKNLNLGSR